MTADLKRGGYTQGFSYEKINPYKSGRGDDKNIQQVQVIKRIVNGVKYDGFEEDVGGKG